MTPADPGSRHLHFEVSGDPGEISALVERIEMFLLDAGCRAGAAQQVAIVAEEILTNIARDAWPGREPGHCVLDLVAEPSTDGINVRLRTEDDGIAFDPTQAPPPDIDAPLEDREIGGLGIMLMKTMTDSQTYRRIGSRNEFEVVKLCPLAASES